MLNEEKSQNTTYCPEMWEYATIFPDGNVYCCCLPIYLLDSSQQFNKQKNSIGNINQKPLKEIWNDKPIQELRRKALSGELQCFNKCGIWREAKIPSGAKPFADYSSLSRIDISVSEKCNIRCVMCYQPKNNPAKLDFSVLKKNVDYSYAKDICLQGGEPFFIEGMMEFFDYLTANLGKRVNFVTNGLLINEDWAERIAKHSDYICFSINAATKQTHEAINKGSSWEKVLANANRVRKHKERLGTKVKIMGHMTIIPSNLSEIAMLINNFKELGFDAIDFSSDISVGGYLQQHPDEKKHLKAAISGALSGKNRSLIDLEEIEYLGLF